MGKKIELFGKSATRNNGAHIQYYNRLTELSISMFEWKNLPETIESGLELALMEANKWGKKIELFGKAQPEITPHTFNITTV